MAKKNGEPTRVQKALSKFVNQLVERMNDAATNKNWNRPWIVGASHVVGLPQNIKGNVYMGGQALLLQLHTMENGYNMPVYMTAKQAREMGAHINKGAKSTDVFKWGVRYYEKETHKRISEKDYLALSDEDKENYEVRYYLKSFIEFNIDQTNFKEVHPDRYDALLNKFQVGKAERSLDTTGMYVNPAMDKLIHEDGAWICPIHEHTGGRAFYSITGNDINVPSKESFNMHPGDAEETYKDGQAYYGVILHEMAHSTGEENHLARPGIVNFQGFGSKSYSKEELVAELTAATVSYAMGFDKRLTENSAAYLKGWASNLKNDPRYIVSVMADVNKATQIELEHIDAQRKALGMKAILEGNLDGIEERELNEAQMEEATRALEIGKKEAEFLGLFGFPVQDTYYNNVELSSVNSDGDLKELIDRNEFYDLFVNDQKDKVIEKMRSIRDQHGLTLDNTLPSSFKAELPKSEKLGEDDQYVYLLSPDDERNFMVMEKVSKDALIHTHLPQHLDREHLGVVGYDNEKIDKIISLAEELGLTHGQPRQSSEANTNDVEYYYAALDSVLPELADDFNKARATGDTAKLLNEGKAWLRNSNAPQQWMIMTRDEFSKQIIAEDEKLAITFSENSGIYDIMPKFTKAELLADINENGLDNDASNVVKGIAYEDIARQFKEKKAEHTLNMPNGENLSLQYNSTTNKIEVRSSTGEEGTVRHEFDYDTGQTLDDNLQIVREELFKMTEYQAKENMGLSEEQKNNVRAFDSEYLDIPTSHPADQLSAAVVEIRENHPEHPLGRVRTVGELREYFRGRDTSVAHWVEEASDRELVEEAKVEYLPSIHFRHNEGRTLQSLLSAHWRVNIDDAYRDYYMSLGEGGLRQYEHRRDMFNEVYRRYSERIESLAKYAKGLENGDSNVWVPREVYLSQESMEDIETGKDRVYYSNLMKTSDLGDSVDEQEMKAVLNLGERNALFKAVLSYKDSAHAAWNLSHLVGTNPAAHKQVIGEDDRYVFTYDESLTHPFELFEKVSDAEVRARLKEVGFEGADSVIAQSVARDMVQEEFRAFGDNTVEMNNGEVLTIYYDPDIKKLVAGAFTEAGYVPRFDRDYDLTNSLVGNMYDFTAELVNVPESQGELKSQEGKKAETFFSFISHMPQSDAMKVKELSETGDQEGILSLVSNYVHSDNLVDQQNTFRELSHLDNTLHVIAENENNVVVHDSARGEYSVYNKVAAAQILDDINRNGLDDIATAEVKGVFYGAVADYFAKLPYTQEPMPDGTVLHYAYDPDANQVNFSERTEDGREKVVVTFDFDVHEDVTTNLLRCFRDLSSRPEYAEAKAVVEEPAKELGKANDVNKVEDINPRDEKKFYTSFAFMQTQEDTEQFEKLREEGKYDEMLFLASEHVQDSGIDLEYIKENARSYQGDDLVTENEELAIVYNGAVGGTYDLLMKVSENDIREEIERVGGLNNLNKPDYPKVVWEIQRDMIEDEWKNAPNGSTVKTDSGKVLSLSYDRENDQILVKDPENENLGVIATVPYDYMHDVNTNFGFVYEEMCLRYPEQQAQHVPLVEDRKIGEDIAKIFPSFSRTTDQGDKILMNDGKSYTLDSLPKTAEVRDELVTACLRRMDLMVKGMQVAEKEGNEDKKIVKLAVFNHFADLFFEVVPDTAVTRVIKNFEREKDNNHRVSEELATYISVKYYHQDEKENPRKALVESIYDGVIMSIKEEQKSLLDQGKDFNSVEMRELDDKLHARGLQVLGEYAKAREYLKSPAEIQKQEAEQTQESKHLEYDGYENKSFPLDLNVENKKESDNMNNEQNYVDEENKKTDVRLDNNQSKALLSMKDYVDSLKDPNDALSGDYSKLPKDSPSYKAWLENERLGKEYDNYVKNPSEYDLQDRAELFSELGAAGLALSTAVRESVEKYKAKEIIQNSNGQRLDVPVHEDSNLQTDVAGEAKKIASSGIPMSKAEKIAKEHADDKTHAQKHEEDAKQAKAAEDKKKQEAEQKKEQKSKDDEKPSMAVTHAAILLAALATAKADNGIWLNKGRRESSEVLFSNISVSPYNELIMDLHAEQKGYRSNIYTFYNTAKDNKMPVMKGQESLPFSWTKWEYVNNSDKSQVLASKQYNALTEEERKDYTVRANRQVHRVYNIDQTIMPAKQHEAYVGLIKENGDKVENIGMNRETSLYSRYNEMTKKHPDCITIMSAGDFYRAYKSSANKISKILGIPVSKAEYIGKQVSFIEFPKANLDRNLQKFIQSGNRTAIVDELADPKLVKSVVNDSDVIIKMQSFTRSVAKADGMNYQRVMEDIVANYNESTNTVSVSGMTVSGLSKEESAIQKASDAYRALAAAMGTANRLDRGGRNHLTPIDDEKYDMLVQELTAGVLLGRQGLPAKMSKENMKLIPYWEREIKENPRMLGIIERDVNNTVEVLDCLSKGEQPNYSKLLGNVPKKELLQKQDYTFVNKLNSYPDMTTKEVVIVKDSKTSKADVILPAGASLEVDNEVSGMRKDRITIALKKDGIGEVKFYNAGGALGLKESNDYFKDKEISVVSLKQYQLVTHDVVKYTPQMEREKIRIEDFKVIKDDDGKYFFHIKPVGEKSFDYKPAKTLVNSYFSAYKTKDNQKILDMRKALSEKIAELASEHPDVKQNLIMPKVPKDIDLSRIVKANITSSAQDKSQKIVTAIIDGQRHTANITMVQWNKMWNAENMSAYKTAVAAVVFEPVLKQGTKEGLENGQKSDVDNEKGQEENRSNDVVPGAGGNVDDVSEENTVREEQPQVKMGMGR